MTRDDIVRLREECDQWAEWHLQCVGEYHPDFHTVSDERFAALVAAAEREAIIKATIDQGFVARALVLAEREKCAQLVETYQKAGNTMGAPEYVMVFKDCAAAIRARSNP